MSVAFNRRINLSDVSFLLPVRIDSAERYKNLLLLLRYLNLYTDTHIFVLEADKAPKISGHLFKSGVHYSFIEDSQEKFHRTHYINQLTWQTDSPYICICDADVIIPLLQLEETVNLLRAGYSYVLPYDIFLTTTDEEEKALFLKTLDCGVFKTGIVWKYACGGAIFLNRADFIRAGMSNEHITSWGPDDVEQKKRMEILGFSMMSVKGPLLHLWHPRGVNSSYENPEERIRLTEEYVRVASCGRAELLQYIDTWKWCKIAFPVRCEPESVLKYNENDCSLTHGLIGAAFVYLCLSRYGSEEEYRIKAVGLLEQANAMLQEELPEGKIGIAWAVGMMQNKYAVPAYLGQICQRVEHWLFGHLKATDGVKREGCDGMLLVGWYYYCLLTGLCPRHYHPVFYKEFLIFVIDQIYDQVFSESKDISVEKLSPKYLGQVLLLAERLMFLGVNTLKTERLCIKAWDKAFAYLNVGETYRPEDGWLLFALLSGAEERKDEEQFSKIVGRCVSYLEQCDGKDSDPRMRWIRNTLYKKTGSEPEGVTGVGDDFFSMLVALEVPSEWLYAWLLM